MILARESQIKKIFEVCWYVYPIVKPTDKVCDCLLHRQYEAETVTCIDSSLLFF